MFGLAAVQERTPEAALQAARRLDPSVDAAQIIPTDLAVGVVYMLADPQTGDLKVFGARTVPAGARVNW
jgi:hypothetical protein